MALPVEATGVSGQGGAVGAARLRVMCSHGGRFLPCGPDGSSRYVGGETRVLVVPRDVSFRELAVKLGEIAGGGKFVSLVRYRLVDDDDVLVSVTCDEELAHMRDEHDRLRATRPSAIFRVFFSGVQLPAASGRPPLAPKMRRVQSEHGRSTRPQHALVRRRLTADEACAERPRRVRVQERARRAPQEPAPEVSAPKTTGRVVFTEAATSKNTHGASPAGQEPAPAVSYYEPEAEPNRRAFWEFE